MRQNARALIPTEKNNVAPRSCFLIEDEFGLWLSGFAALEMLLQLVLEPKWRLCNPGNARRLRICCFIPFEEWRLPSSLLVAMR